MKVKYLIELLSKQNPDAEIKLHHFDSTFGAEDVLFVMSRKNDSSVVWIESKNDVDLDSQIQARYLDVHVNKESEETHCRDFYNHGITVEEIRHAVGDKAAGVYERFLKEKYR